VLNFVQANPRRCNLKEVKNTLRLSIDDVSSINQAIHLLSQMTELAGVQDEAIASPE
jgi:transcription-repair coupling factor (superfamily II helicase)